MPNTTLQHLAFFFLASALTACSSGAADTSPAGGSGGADTSGTTESSGTGEHGTSAPSGGAGVGGDGTTTTGGGGDSTTTSTGGDGTTTTGTDGGGAAPSACALGCETMGGKCVEDECQFGDKTLVPSIQEMSYLDSSGLEIQLASADVRFYPAGTKLPSFTVLGSAGPCTAVTFPGPPGDPGPYDVGTVTVQGPELPATALTPPKYHQSLSNKPEIIAPGDVVEFTVAGGPDFPAFTAQATAPEDIDLVVPTIHASQPVTITWNPETPLSYLTIFTSKNGIICTPAAPGSIEIPVSLLSLLDPPAASPHAIVTGDRRVTVNANVDSPGAQATVMIGLSRIVQVSFEP